MAYPNDIRGLLQEFRSTINTGGASVAQYPDSILGLLQSIRDILNTGNSATSQYTNDVNGLLTNIRDLLNTGNSSVSQYTRDQLGLWKSIRDLANTVSVDTTKYPSDTYGIIQSLRDIALLGGAGGPSYDAAATAIFNAFTTPPTTARKATINTCVLALKAAGVWTLLDAIYVLAAADSQAARINWKSPSTGTLTATNSPTFVADRGFTGDGATSYLLGPAWSTFTQYAQNSSTLFDWVLTNVDSANSEIGSDQAGQPALINAHTGANASVRASSSTTASVAVSGGVGFTGAFRNASDQFTFQRDASQSAVTSNFSSGTPAGNFVLCRAGGGFVNRQIALGGAGAGLSGAQGTAAYNAFLAYMQAVGAA